MVRRVSFAKLSIQELYQMLSFETISYISMHLNKVNQ
jgi:hypothetical protein